MKPDDLIKVIDNTMLAPDASRAEVEGFVRASSAYPFAAVLVPPVYVSMAAGLLKGLGAVVGTVAGFPLGYQAAGVKAFEARKAVEEGAGEIDMVMNVSAFRSGEDALVLDEISGVVAAANGAVVKVIIEAALLDDEEKVRATGLVAEGGAQFVKTSTGFGPGGATARDVRILVEAASGLIGVKASGGIRTLKDALVMIEAGAVRIGTSSGLDIARELESGGL